MEVRIRGRREDLMTLIRRLTGETKMRKKDILVKKYRRSHEKFCIWSSSMKERTSGGYRKVTCFYF